MSEDELLKKLPAIRGQYNKCVNLSTLSRLQVGGCVDVLFQPRDIDDLSHFLRCCPKDIPLTILGAGSNVLICDDGISGVLIKLGRGFAEIYLNNNRREIVVGAAALDSQVVVFAQQHGIGGMEFLYGIPGTVGGALALNAGAYDVDISDVLEYVIALDRDGNKLEILAEDLGYGYRECKAAKELIFVSAVLRGNVVDKDVVQNNIDKFYEQRKKSQPINTRTCGSTFKNPEGYKAWELIKDANCIGMRVGDAVVSAQHCNFLINDGSATFYDFEKLIEKIKEKVHGKFGVLLEEEIIVLGRKKNE
jgi:UDP-N-acetylmuramate dehydrogenase